MLELPVPDVFVPVVFAEVFPASPTMTVIDCMTIGMTGVWSLLTSWTAKVCSPAVTFVNV